MKSDKYAENRDNNLLLEQFNTRDRDAFGRVYLLFYRELYYYTYNLYQSTNIEPDDVIQDVFLNIWQSKSRKFDKLEGIKAYLYIAIRNGSKNFHIHNKIVNRYNREMLEDDDLFVVQMAESEVFSIIPKALNMLPEECSRTFKMFIEGWDIKEIAEKLGKKRSTIYNQRQKAIEILKESIQKNIYNLFFFLP